jgi:hypothetical protein
MNQAIILPPPAGLFSIFNHVVGSLARTMTLTKGFEEYYQTQPTVAIYDTFYSTDTNNLWNLLFEPIGYHQLPRQQIMALMSKGVKGMVIDDEGGVLREDFDSSCSVGLGFSSEKDDNQILEGCHSAIKKYVKVIPNVSLKINKYKESFVGKVVGIHYRGTDKPRELLPYLKAMGREERIPSIKEYIDAAEKHHPDTIFIATDCQRALDEAIRLKPNIIYTDSVRSDDDVSLHEGNGNECRAEESLIDTYLLSNCHHIVHSLSNIPQAALMINKSLTGTFLL